MSAASPMSVSKPMDACFLCKETGTVPLTCGKHKLCVKCVKKNAKEKQLSVDDMDQCPVEGCADQAAVAATSPDPIWIFADNSNIWIEAKKLGTKVFRTGRVCEADHRIRIDYGSLMEVVGKERRVVEASLYGSKPPDKDSLWNKIRERGWKVHIKPRSSLTNKEKEVDSSIVADIVELARTPSTKGTIVLITGDADMRPAVEKVVKYKTWKIEVGVWKSILSHRLTSLAEKSENVSEINLDDDWDNIVYIENEFSVKYDIPTHSSAVLTVSFSTIDTSWWNKLEEVTQWPVQYKWIKGGKKQLLLVFGKGLKPGDIKSLEKDLKRLPHVQGFEMFDDYDRRETLEKWLSASRGKGLEISGNFVRRERQIHADMTFKILSSKARVLQVIKNLSIRFNANSFGLTPGGPLSVHSQQPNNSATTRLPVTPGGNVMKMTPLTQLQVAVENNVTSDVFYFSMNVPMHVLFAEDGKMDCKKFQEWWRNAKNSYNKQVQNVSLTIGQIRKRLKDNNVFLLKEWQVNMKGIKHDHIYMSLKLINNIWVLIEAKMAPEAANIEFIFKTKAGVPDVIDGIYDSFERHIFYSYI